LDAFGGRDEFVGRYCPPTVTAYGLSYKNQQNLQELADNLKTSCFIRRTKEDCLDLPEKTWVDVDLDLGNDHFFDAILKEMRNGSEQEALRAARKCYTWAELDQHIAKARAQVGEKKISAIVEITDSIAQAEQVVVMVHHRAVQEEVRKRLSKKHNVGYVTGGMTMKRRQQEIDDFTAGNTQVIVCSIQAAGTGINLQVASQMVIGELPMDYATLDQASDRIHRIGTKNKVTITKIVAVNTVDDLLLHIINSKAQVSSQVEDGKDADLSDIYDIVAARAVALYGKK
jgi:SNF2 family DNA or RNA helicase